MFPNLNVSSTSCRDHYNTVSDSPDTSFLPVCSVAHVLVFTSLNPDFVRVSGILIQAESTSDAKSISELI